MRTGLLLASVLLLVLIFVALPTPSTPAPSDLPVPSELAQARLKAAEEAYSRFLKLQPGQDEWMFDPEVAYTWSKRLLEAEREVARDHKGVVAAFERHRDRMVTLEAKTKTREKNTAAKGIYYQPDALARLAAAAFYPAEAEHWLEQAKAKK
jgi:hypothetical protein